MTSSPQPSYVYHYTSMVVFLELFKQLTSSEEYLTFHASSVNYMNDVMEYAAAKNECATIVEEISSECQLGFPFAISFSENKDSVPMWLAYADGGEGVCLQFDLSGLCSEFTSSDINANSFYQFRHCEYKDGIKVTTDKNWDDETTCILPKDLNARVVNASFCKLNSFEYENEWRLALWRKTWNESNANETSKFKLGKRGVCHYTEVRIPKRCLTGIIIGSAYNWQLIQDLNFSLPAAMNPNRNFIKSSGSSLIP